MKRVKINGFSRYTSDGVSVYRGAMKQRLYKDGFHLLADGAKVNFTVVEKKDALAGNMPKPKAKEETKSKGKKTGGRSASSKVKTETKK